MAGVINSDREGGQVESPESSARQFSKQSEMEETKGIETEKIWKRLSLPPNKINNNNNNKINNNKNNNNSNNNIMDALDKGEFHRCTSQIEASTSPRATPRAYEFLEIFVQIPPSPGRKAVQMPHPGENYQIAVLTFQ